MGRTHFEQKVWGWVWGFGLGKVLGGNLLHAVEVVCVLEALDKTAAWGRPKAALLPDFIPPVEFGSLIPAKSSTRAQFGQSTMSIALPFNEKPASSWICLKMVNTSTVKGNESSCFSYRPRAAKQPLFSALLLFIDCLAILLSFC